MLTRSRREAAKVSDSFPSAFSVPSVLRAAADRALSTQSSLRAQRHQHFVSWWFKEAIANSTPWRLCVGLDRTSHTEVNEGPRGLDQISVLAFVAASASEPAITRAARRGKLETLRLGDFETRKAGKREARSFLPRITRITRMRTQAGNFHRRSQKGSSVLW